MSEDRIMGIPREALLAMLDGASIEMKTPVGTFRAAAVPNAEWQPLYCRPTPTHIIEHHARAGIPAPTSVWSNEIYEVFVTEDGSGMTYLSIKRYDRAAVHNWRHFQQIKNEICGTEREGIEVYPRESRLADNANQYHLHVLPEGVDVPVGFEGGMVVRSDDDVEAMNTNGSLARQEPFQPGISVGLTMQEAQDNAGPQDERVQAILKGRPL